MSIRRTSALASTAAQWDQFEDWVSQAVAFRNAARAHRTA